MRYREYQPPPAFTPWIDCVWTLSGAGGGPDPVLPDGRTEIVLNFADRFRRHTDAAVERQPRALFVGPMRGAVVLEPEGAIDIAGIRLRPAAAAALLRLPMGELEGRIPGLDDVAPRLARMLDPVADSADRPGAIFARLEPLLRAARPPDPRVERATTLLEAAHGDRIVDRAAREVAWSPRQLQRRFLQDVGLGPKTFARIARVQSAARAAPLAAQAGWAAIAVRCGFFDQAHLIREFRAIAGRSPAAYFAGTHPLGALFTGG